VTIWTWAGGSNSYSAPRAVVSIVLLRAVLARPPDAGMLRSGSMQAWVLRD
jgi:hypothetical protein